MNNQLAETAILNKIKYASSKCASAEVFDVGLSSIPIPARYHLNDHRARDRSDMSTA